MAPLFDGCGARTLSALHDVEPDPYWDREILIIRAHCYVIAKDPRAQDAWRDLERHRAAEPGAVVDTK
jgi:hypothetical protein